MLTFKEFRQQRLNELVAGPMNPAYSVHFGDYRNDKNQQSTDSRQIFKDEETNIQKGKFVTGKEIKTDKQVTGVVISVRKDERNNVIFYLIKDDDSGELYKCDPSSVADKTEKADK